MRTIELAYALCLVSPWMHNRSVTRAGATSSYKLVAETVLVVAILRALMLVIGTSVTTADVHLEVLVDDLFHRRLLGTTRYRKYYQMHSQGQSRT